MTGVATNLAARLQTAAGPGEIVLSDEAHRRVEGWLRERGRSPEREELVVKGFDEPQGAYRLPAPAPASVPEPLKAGGRQARSSRSRLATMPCKPASALGAISSV